MSLSATPQPSLNKVSSWSSWGILVRALKPKVLIIVLAYVLLSSLPETSQPFLAVPLAPVSSKLGAWSPKSPAEPSKMTLGLQLVGWQATYGPCRLNVVNPCSSTTVLKLLIFHIYFLLHTSSYFTAYSLGNYSSRTRNQHSPLITNFKFCVWILTVCLLETYFSRYLYSIWCLEIIQEISH